MTTNQPTAYKETIIERVAWQGPEPGSPSFNKPSWRLITWNHGADKAGRPLSTIDQVLQSERLSVILSYVPWAIVPFVAEVERAIKALGRADVDGTRANYRQAPTWRLVLTSKHVHVANRDTGEERVWAYGSGSWVSTKAAEVAS